MLAPLLGCGEHPWDGVDTPSSILTGAAVCNIGQPWYSADRSRVGISPMLSQAELFSGTFGQAKRWGTHTQGRAKQCEQPVCGHTAAAGGGRSIQGEKEENTAWR